MFSIQFSLISSILCLHDQLEVLNFSLKRNSLVCLPTGSGKTLVSIAVIHAMLRINPSKIAVFCVKTNPLVEQQAKAIEFEVPELRVRKLSGQIGIEVIKKTRKVCNFWVMNCSMPHSRFGKLCSKDFVQRIPVKHFAVSIFLFSACMNTAIRDFRH